MAGVEVIPVRNSRDLRAFIEFPWVVYSDDPRWVPPIKRQVAKLLDPARHPFWKFAARELFLARRGAEVVGRIAAIRDDRYNDYQHEKMAAFGFFECLRDAEAAAALFSAAASWARAQGLTFLRGPLSPSLNYEAGLLVQGFESRPTLLMTYNPPYYLELVKLCRFRKEKDLFTYLFTKHDRPPAWALELGERLLARGEITVRRMDPSRFDAEVRLLTDIFIDSWKNNWGFSPPTFEEVRAMVQDIYPIIDLDLAFFLEFKGEAVGVCIIIPDINPLLKRFNGKLGLTALVKKYLYRDEIVGFRGFILGVREAYRQMGAPFVALAYLLRIAAAKKADYAYVELGWNLEDNQAINLLYEEGGLTPYKRYRLFRKDLT